jgi:hypothetical protein
MPPAPTEPDITTVTKLILSRKGFDASAGGHPSPILPGGRMLSLPIPESGTGARYATLRTPWGATYAEVMAAQGIGALITAGARIPWSDHAEAHLDPDLVAGTRGRPPGWRPAFGQAGSAQTVLARAGVGVGDLFMFFGWFKPGRAAAAELGLDPRRHLHVIWGWLRVGAVLDAGAATRAASHRDHPHVVRPDRSNNTLYVAAEEAVPGIPGAGTFAFRPELVLTAPDATGRAGWLLPACLGPAATTLLPRHASRFGERVEDRIRFDARYRWQEFVADATPAVQAWATDLLTSQ